DKTSNGVRVRLMPSSMTSSKAATMPCRRNALSRAIISSRSTGHLRCGQQWQGDERGQRELLEQRVVAGDVGTRLFLELQSCRCGYRYGERLRLEAIERIEHVVGRWRARFQG